MYPVALVELFDIKAKKTERGTATTGKLLCFWWYFRKMTFSLVRALVCQVTNWTCVNLKPFCSNKPEIKQYITQWVSRLAQSSEIEPKHSKPDGLNIHNKNLNCCSNFIYAFRISMDYMISISLGRIFRYEIVMYFGRLYKYLRAKCRTSETEKICVCYLLVAAADKQHLSVQVNCLNVTGTFFASRVSKRITKTYHDL